MTAGCYDIEIEKGVNFNRIITWKDGTGMLVNLTGFTARMQARDCVYSDTILFELTSANGEIVIDETLSTISLIIDDVTTAAIPGEIGVYDLELIAPTGEVTRLLQGNLTFTAEVTR